MQILLDQGKDLDWFNSTVIVGLGLVSGISLLFFIIWELAEKHPIVDLTLFERRNFTVGVVAISLGYMVFFGSVVILPLWLQTEMNYTATWAGLATAPLGLVPIFFSPCMGYIMSKFDLRVIVSLGFFIFGACSFLMANFNTDVAVGNVAFIRFLQGFGVPCFFIPCTSILLSGLPNNRLASAAGLSNFLRILAGSFGVSIYVTLWDHRESLHQSKMVEGLSSVNAGFLNALHKMHGLGLTDKASYAVVMHTVVNQAYMLATEDVFWFSGIIFMFLLILVWFARPPFLTKGAVPMAD